MTSEATITPAKNSETPRWVWALLVLSLAINLLIVGIFVGNSLATRDGNQNLNGAGEANTQNHGKNSEQDGNGHQADTNVADGNEGIGSRRRYFMLSLSRERRAEVRQIFLSHTEELRPYRRDVREARRQVVELVARGGYSQEELNKAIDDLGAAEAKARKAAKPMIIAILEKLDNNERMLFLKTFGKH
jgi:uncharacterized membrane protein